MPVSPDQVEYLAAQTADLYADAEHRLLALCARQLAAGMEAPGWAVAKIGALSLLRRAAEMLLDALAGNVDQEVRRVVAEAYESGRHSALAELGVLGDDDRRTVAERTPQAQAVDRLAAETIETVTATHRGILRGVEDGYRQVVAEVTAAPLLGIDSRRQATQQAMTRFADRGVSSFRDRSGRRWQLTSYAEMAVRTSVGRAATEAHMTTLAAAGVDLVVVSSSPRECPLCRRWERKVLSIGGPSGARTVDVEHATDDGRMIRVDIAGTLDEARVAGLQHPNCRHSVSAYSPGITRTEDAEPDPAGYEAGQRQRAIERRIRKYKQRAAAAVTPEGRRAAEAKARQWQGAMRSHLAAHPQLRRLRNREQPGASNLPKPQTRPGEDMMQAARVRSGDERTLSEMDDEQMVTAIRTGVLDRRDHLRVAAEYDRRYPATPPPAATGGTVADYAANRAALDEALGPVRLDGPPPADPDEWGAYGRDIERGPDGTAHMSAAEKWVYERELADRMARTAYTRDEVRAMYREHTHLQWLAAEDATRGHMLTREAEAAGVDPRSLFSGPAHIAYARASEDLRRFWDDVSPRVTLAEFTEQVSGVANEAAETARHAAHDQRRKR